MAKKNSAPRKSKNPSVRPPAKWNNYEEVSRHLLNMFAQDFGVDFFEGKQRLKGKLTQWEIDAKGVQQAGGAILVVECRRFTTARQSQGRIAQLAFSIQDLGAFGGIVVSPFDLQAGAQKIAAGTNIQRVRLDPNSTVESFHAVFIDKL